MSDQGIVNLLGCLVWFFIGAAVLSLIKKGLLDVAEKAHADESFMNMVKPLGTSDLAAVFIIGWLIGCLLWPYFLVRHFSGYGLINGHLVKDCPSKTKVGEKNGIPKYRHGRECMKKEK